MRTALAALAIALGLGGCGGETRLTEDTFRVDPTLLPGCIELSVTRLQFEARIGETDERRIRVISACDGFLELRDIVLDDGQTPFDITLPRDLVLEPGVQVDVLVRFEPLVLGSFSDRLFIRSNDEDLPQAEVVLAAETVQ